VRASTCALLGNSADLRTAERLRSLQRSDGGWALAGKPTLSATYWAIATLAALNEKPFHAEAAARFIADRLYPDGHFDDLPRAVARPATADADSAQTQANADLALGKNAAKGHVWLTYCGVAGLTALGYEVPWKRAVIRWLQACQQEDGGFSWRPGPRPTGGSDLWYTWLAIASLRALGTSPLDSAGAVRFVNACQNEDGGFGDKPGWDSRLAATDYALRAIADLCGDLSHGIRSKALTARDHRPPASWERLAVYHHYGGPLPDIESPDRRSPWWPGLPVYHLGVSLTEAEHYLLAPALAIRDSLLAQYLWQLPYPTFVGSVQTGLYAERSIGFWVPNRCCPDTVRALHAAWDAVCAESPCDTVEWREFAREVLKPLTGCGLIPYERIETGDQVADYLAMDELLEPPQVGLAVVCALSDGTDMVRRMPFLERLKGRVPFVVQLVPFSGAPPDRARLLWLGERGDCGELRSALAGGRTACAIRDDAAPGGVLLYGDPQVVAVLEARRTEWQW